MQRERFCDVIDRACDGTSLVSVAARWGTKEQNLRRWRDNLSQSPTFDDLQAMAKRMTSAERIDVAKVLLGDQVFDEVRESVGHQMKQLADALDDARTTIRPLARV